MNFLTRDRSLALATLLLVGLLFVEATGIPGRTSWQPYGSAFYPRLLLGALGLLAAILLVRTFLPGQRGQPPFLPALRAFFRTQGRIVALFVIFAVYAALLPLIGFIWATMAFLLVSFAVLMRERNRRSVLVAVVVAVVTTLLVYATFRYGLGIRLP